MLAGIHILSETTRYTAEGSVAGGVFSGLIAVFWLIGIIFAIIEKEIDWIAGCTLGFLLAGLVSFICIDANINRTEYKEYKVTIDDSVKMTEFNKKYNIINQEGIIYTITMKEESDK